MGNTLETFIPPRRLDGLSGRAEAGPVWLPARTGSTHFGSDV